jgi:hypothetical protein
MATTLPPNGSARRSSVTGTWDIDRLDAFD